VAIVSSKKQDFLTTETQSQKTDLLPTNKPKKVPVNKSKNAKRPLFFSYFYACCWLLRL